MPAVSSAAGLLALLAEPSDELKAHALQNLNKVPRGPATLPAARSRAVAVLRGTERAEGPQARRIDLTSRPHGYCRPFAQVVHDYWFQISGNIGSVEALYEDDDFAHRELAALLASKVGRSRGPSHLAAHAVQHPQAQPCAWLRSGHRRVCSVHAQVFYHLGELDDALNYALGAGSLFDVEEQSEYVTTLVGEFPPQRSSTSQPWTIDTLAVQLVSLTWPNQSRGGGSPPSSSVSRCSTA
jgi:26S proteasome regulatory subunit N2